MNIILGLLEPSEGKIIIDDIEISENKQWFPEVSYVPQDIYLKDDTINNNIMNFSTKFRDDEIVNKKLEKILQFCGLDYLKSKGNFDLNNSYVINNPETNNAV